jgi:hypothetical protein
MSPYSSAFRVQIANLISSKRVMRHDNQLTVTGRCACTLVLDEIYEGVAIEAEGELGEAQILTLLSCSPLRMMEQHMSTTAMTTGTCSDGPIPRLYSTPLQLVSACIKSLSPREHRAHQRAARLDQDGDNKIKLAEHRSRGDLATGEMDGDDDLARCGKQPDREGGNQI